MPSISPPPVRAASGVEHDRPDLGARGVVALLTPAETPTAEPELSLLLPPDVNLLTARMYAPASEMSARLRAYETRLEEWLAPFGDAPLDAVAFACTGSTYLLGPSRRRPEALKRRHGPCPVVCAADALKDGLQSLRAQRIILVSPYPAALTEAAAQSLPIHALTRPGAEEASIEFADLYDAMWDRMGHELSISGVA